MQTAVDISHLCVPLSSAVPSFRRHSTIVCIPLSFSLTESIIAVFHSLLMLIFVTLRDYMSVWIDTTHLHIF